MDWIQLLGAAGAGAIVVKLLDIFWLTKRQSEQQRRAWLRDQRYKAYSELSRELVTFGLHLRNQRSPFESFAVATNVTLLLRNAELSQRIDDFIVNVDRMNGLVENGGEGQLLEANILHGELMREARVIIGELRDDLTQDRSHGLRPLLNGWRRFGIVITTLWFIAVIALALVEYSSKADGLFVLQGIPVGTVVVGNKVTLPDGKVITITEEEEFKLRFKMKQELNRLKTGQPLRPWELDWSSLTSVPRVMQVRWLRLGFFALLAPLIVWVIGEAAVFTATWVRRGFASTRSET